MGQGPKEIVDSVGAQWPSPHPSSRRFDLYREDPLTEMSVDSGANKCAESLMISAKKKSKEHGQTLLGQQEHG